MSNQYDIRSVDQMLSLLDQGEFLEEILEGQKELNQAMLEHRDIYGGKTKGKLTLTLDFELAKKGDVVISGTYAFKAPKKPAASGVAYTAEDGGMSVYSPMLERMQVRDTNYDPETGEIREPDIKQGVRDVTQ